MLKQAVQILAHRARLLSHTHGILELAENLRLAEDHRIESAGNPKDVPYRFVFVERENCVAEGGIQAAVVAQPVMQLPAPGIACHDIKLSAIAGR